MTGLGPKPRTRREQLRFALSKPSMEHIRKVSERTNLRMNQVIEQIISESIVLERRVKKLGFRHAGEALAVLEQERG